MVLSIALIFALVLLAILVLVPILIALVKDLLGLAVRLNHYSSTKPKWVGYYLLAVVAFLVLVVVFG